MERARSIWSGVGAAEDEEEDEDNEDEGEGDAEDEDDGDDLAFVGFTEEELAAQDMLFAQDVLSEEDLSTAGTNHRCGAHLSRLRAGRVGGLCRPVGLCCRRQLMS